MNKKTLFLTGFLTASMLVSGALSAQAKVNPARTSDLSDNDWNAWRTGVITSEEADKAYLGRQYTAAAALYEKTIKLFQSVQKSNPSWNKKGLADRISLLERKLNAAKRRQSEQTNVKTVSAEQEIAAVNADAIAEIAELKLALESVRKQNVRYKENLERAEKTAKQIESLLAEKEEMEKKHSLLLIQYSDLKEKAASREVDQAIKTAFETEKQRTKTLEAELQKNKLVMDELKKALTVSAKEKTELTENTENLKKRLDEISALEKEISALQSRLQQADQTAAAGKTAAQTEIKRLTDALAKKSREADEAGEALTKLRAGMNLDAAARQLEQTAAALRADNDALQKEIATLRNELNAQTLVNGNKTKSLEQTKNLAKNLTEQNQRLAMEIERMQKTLSTTGAEAKRLAATLDESKKSVELLKKERDTFAGQLVKYQKEGAVSANAELAIAKAQLKTLTERNQTLSADVKKVDELTKSLQTAEAKLKQAENEVKALLSKESAANVSLKKIASLQKELEQKEQAAANVKADIARQQKQFAEKEAAWKSADSAKDQKLAETVKKLEDLQKLSADTEKTAKELSTLRDSLLVLETEKAALTSEKEELKKVLAYHEKKAQEYTRITSNEALLKSVLQENRILKVELENARSVKPEEKFVQELALAKQSVEQYQNRYQQNLDEMNRIKGQHLEMRLQMVEMEKQLTALKKENGELKKDPAAKEEQEKRQKAEQEKLTLRNKLAENGKRIAELEDQIKNLMQKNTAMIRVEELLKKENAELAKKLADSTPALKKLEDKISAMEKAAGEQLKKAEALSREKTALETKMNQVADAEKQTNAKIKDLELKLTEKDKKIAELAKGIKQFTQSKNTDQVKVLEQKISAMEKAAGEQLKKAEALSREKTALETKMNQAADAEKQTNAKIKDLELKLTEKDKEIAELAKGVKQFTLSKNTDLIQVKTLEQKIAAQEKTITELQKELQSAKKNTVNTAAGTVNAANISLLEQKIAAKDKEITALKTDLQNMSETMKKVASGAESAKNSELENLRSEQKVLIETIRTLQDEKAKNGEASLEAKKELLSVKAQLEKLRAETAADETAKNLKNQLDTAQKKLDTLTASEQKLQQNLTEVKSMNQTLSGQKSKLEKDLTAAQKEMAHLQAEVRKWVAGSDSVVQSKLEEKNLAITQLLEEHTLLTKEIETIKAALKTTETDAAASKREANELRAELEKLKNAQKKNSTATETTAVVTTGIRLTPDGYVKTDKEPAVKTAPPAAKPAPLSAEDQKRYDDAMKEAAAFEKDGDLDSAMWKYLTAADIAKQNWQPHFAMSRIYLAGNKIAKARKEYETALKLGMERNKAHEDNMAKQEKGN